MRFRLLLFLFAVASHAEPHGTPQEEVSFDQYRLLIEVYRSGEFQWVVEALANVAPPEVERFAARLREFAHEKGKQFPQRRVSATDLKTAVLLHTQAAVMKSNEREAEAE